MAKKEAKTDLWVARQLDDSKIEYDAQGSDVKEINDALQSASKRGTGNAGYPEYVAVVKDFVIVIEDKADLAKHQKLTDTGILSTDQKDIADYAVNGAYFYAKHIAQNSSFHKIFAIGVSGDEKHHKITPLYVDDREGYKQLPDIESFTSFTASNTLGHRYKENGIQYLYHDDVLKLFCRLLDNAKFRRVFADKYPLILIDEYQDSYKPIIDRFISFFIAEKKGPQFGFFGDAWQTIYQSNNACGLIENDNLEIIKKGSNFRSAPRIVQLLNDLRPDLPQASAIDDFDGEVIVITCDDYTGPRRIERNLKGELPAEELKNRLSNVTEKIKRESSKDDTLKVLMITHKVLATQQGYEQLLEILADGLRDKEDPFLMFFMDTVEPIYKALKNSNMQLLFDTLGIKRFPIKKKSEKAKWKELQQQLENARTKRAIDVFELIKQSKLIPIPPKLDGWYHLYQEAPETVYASNASIQSFLELEYLQFAAVIDFLLPDAMFSTEHGVKGEEYDNVVFVIGKGWNLYQFETYAPMITGHSSIPKGKEASFERNRNLFYVCCSRAKKRLFLFVTVPTDYEFKAFLMSLIGKDNIYTYSQFLEMER